MSTSTQATRLDPTFVELFTPKLLTVWREGYGLRDLRADAVSGLTVAVVALPLSMAIAIASGVSPERGLYTAIAGGFIVSLLGGSRFQIGGPAGAFIGLVAGVVERHGYDGLALATVVAGLIMLAVALLRAGTYVKYIPFPVTVAFTAGIAVLSVRLSRSCWGLKSTTSPRCSCRSSRRSCMRCRRRVVRPLRSQAFLSRRLPRHLNSVRTGRLS